ncbi:MAG: methyltransferase domain-containing protein [Pseudomonadota bacterium]
MTAFPDKADSQDNYAFGMDWGGDEVSIGSLTNYRRYQYNLVADHIGRNVLEVGSGASRSFTRLVVDNKPDLERMLSIEPSQVLWEKYKTLGNHGFPDSVTFDSKDLFDLDVAETGDFDTALFIHVLEHIEDDRGALNHTHGLLEDGGRVLIEVPALPFLFSVHDEMLGHYRRYNKQMLKSAIDPDLYEIEDMWYNDLIGVLGSLYFFKFRKMKLKSEQGVDAIQREGKIYDQYLIPFQQRIERFIRPPLGLSLNAVLRKK